MNEEAEFIICEICGEKGTHYKDTEYDHPHFTEVDGHDDVCKTCFLSGIGFM